MRPFPIRSIFALAFAGICALAACSGGGAGSAPGGSHATPSQPGRVSPSPTAASSASPGVTPTPATTPSAAAGAAIGVDGTHALATIPSTILGANMAVWFDITQPGIAPSLQTAGFTATRWPGGSDSDAYHWMTNTLCAGGYANGTSTFDNFMKDVAQPAGLDVAITLNYGSNAACTGGGDPSEAAAWVNYANNTKHYGIHWWTVGNEEYGSWEYDLHAAPHDPTTYAGAVAGSGGYYASIKAQDPSAQVGVVVSPGYAWDPIVLSQAKYDFVELHWYAQAPGSESDSYLTTKAPQALTAAIATLKSEMSTAGANVPIYLGELGSVYSNPGKQSSSITEALFAGQVIGELLDDGVARSTWWLGYGGCSDASSGNFSSSLYGWQSFGGYMLLSDGLPESGCSSAPALPLGTLLPTARAYQVASGFARSGEKMYAATVSSTLPNVRAYAASHGTGYALMLFNLDPANGVTVPVTINTLGSGSTVTIVTYGKAQYDQSKTGVWAGPVTSSSGAWRSTFSVTLPVWSMNVVTVTL
jgi:hypothetical protein